MAQSEIDKVRQATIDLHVRAYHSMSLSKDSREALYGRLMKEFYQTMERELYRYVFTEEINEKALLETTVKAAATIVTQAMDYCCRPDIKMRVSVGGLLFITYLEQALKMQATISARSNKAMEEHDPGFTERLMKEFESGTYKPKP